MTKILALMAKVTALGAILGLFLAACQGHYNPRLHVDDTPPPPGQVKQHWYNQ